MRQAALFVLVSTISLSSACGGGMAGSPGVGVGGSTGFGVGGSGAGVGGAGGAAAPVCGIPGAACPSGTGCCAGETCLAMSSGNICASNCTNDGQCESGCCTALQGGAGAVCAPASYCPAPACADSDQSCVDVACCSGLTCVNDGTAMVTVCAAPCSDDSQCASGCCLPLASGNGAVCSPPSYCAPPVPTPGCADLVLAGYDGAHLGNADSDPVDPDGVCNPSGAYGSELATGSIYDPYGIYGSPYSTLSAYNATTYSAPFLYCVSTGESFNYVSKNPQLPNVIDPDALCATLQTYGY
jgi:hypothetical protein